MIIIVILKEVLGVINILSTTLQSKSSTLGSAKNIINGVIQSFEKLRTDNAFSELWLNITSLCEQHNITLEVFPSSQ